MQVGKVRFIIEQLLAGDRLLINVWIGNGGDEPVDNMYRFFEGYKGVTVGKGEGCGTK